MRTLRERDSDFQFKLILIHSYSHTLIPYTLILSYCILSCSHTAYFGYSTSFNLLFLNWVFNMFSRASVLFVIERTPPAKTSSLNWKYNCLTSPSDIPTMSRRRRRGNGRRKEKNKKHNIQVMLYSLKLSW